MNEYSVKTALYREKTGKGTKFLTFLAFWYPILRALPNIISILAMMGATSSLEYSLKSYPPTLALWYSAFVYAILILSFLLVVSDLSLGYFLTHLKPLGFYWGVVSFSFRTLLTVGMFLLVPSFLYFLDLLLCILIVIYLIKRKSLYGIATKNQPAITLSPDVILHNSVFKCGVTWQMGGTIRFTDTHLVMEGDFLPSKTFSFPYETLQVQHNKLMLCWQFQNMDSKQQIQVKILPFHGNGLKKLLRQQGVTPTVK